jgi:hypothetical protein
MLACRLVSQRRDTNGIALDGLGELGKEAVDQPLDVLSALA